MGGWRPSSSWPGGPRRGLQLVLDQHFDDDDFVVGKSFDHGRGIGLWSGVDRARYQEGLGRHLQCHLRDRRQHHREEPDGDVRPVLAQIGGGDAQRFVLHRRLVSDGVPGFRGQCHLHVAVVEPRLVARALTDLFSPGVLTTTLERIEAEAVARAAGISVHTSSATYGGLASSCATLTSNGQPKPVTYCVANSSGILTYSSANGTTVTLTAFTANPPASTFSPPSGATVQTLPAGT